MAAETTRATRSRAETTIVGIISNHKKITAAAEEIWESADLLGKVLLETPLTPVQRRAINVLLGKLEAARLNTVNFQRTLET